MVKYDKEYFKKQLDTTYIEDRKESIEVEKQHISITNRVLKLFTTDGIIKMKGGYHAVTLEPLFDLEEYLKGVQCKTFDLLVFNELSKKMIFIEVKSSTKYHSGILSDFQDKVKAVRDRFAKIQEVLNINVNEEDAEYVLLIPLEQAYNIINKINSDNLEDIIPWTFPSITNMTLNHPIIGNIPDLIKFKRTHKDGNLRKTLFGGISMQYLPLFNFFVSSDPFLKMQYFVPLIHSAKLEKFNFVLFKDRFLSDARPVYTNQEDAHKFIYLELIRNLKITGKIELIDNKGDELLNNYKLKFNPNFTEPNVKRELGKLFFEGCLKDKELFHDKEAERLAKEAKGQKELLDF